MKKNLTSFLTLLLLMVGFQTVMADSASDLIASLSSEKYYTIKINRPTALNVFVDPTDNSLIKTVSTVQIGYQNQDYFKWQLAGNAENGYTMKNKATGSFVTFGSANPANKTTATLTDNPAEGAYFDIVANGDFVAFKLHGTTVNAYISNNGGVGTTFLTNWNHANNIGDAGAQLIIAEADEIQPTYADDAAIQAAKQILTYTGLGYPTAQASARIALATLLEESQILTDALENAVTAFKKSGEISIPENGKQYTLTFIAKNGNKWMLNNGETKLMAPAQETPQTAIWTATVGGDNKVTFSNGGKFVKYDSFGDTEGDDTKWQVLAMNASTSPQILSGSDLFGLVYLEGKRPNSNTGQMIIKNDGSDFAGTNAPFYNDSYTSAIMVEEVKATVAAGTEEDPIILTAGVPANGPKAAGEYPYTYTYYQYTATQAGVIKLNTTDLGYVMGNIIIGESQYGYGSSVVVAEGDVVTVKLTAQADATAKTFTLTIRDLAEGETKETAKTLAEGSNNIAAIQNGGLPMYYSISVPAQKKVTIKFDGYPSADMIVGETATPVEYADGGYTATYNNDTEEAVTVIVMIKALGQACTATVSFSDATPTLPAITKLGAPVFSVPAGEDMKAIADKDELDAAPAYIRITFPETDAQPEDVVMVNAYVFEADADGNQQGAPLNISNNEYTSTIQDGVAITGIAYEAGKSYIVNVSSVNIRETGDNGHGGKTYAYSYPNAEEHDPIVVNFAVKASSATSFAITGATNAGNAPESEVEVLSYMFEITAANAITALHEGNITLTDAENQPVGGNATVLGYEGEGGATTVYARFAFDTEDHNLHTAGTYTLNVPAGMFKDAEGNLSEAFTATWTVKEQGETSTFAIISATNGSNEPGEVEALSYMFTINAANAITALHEGNITLTDAENQPVGGNATVSGYEGEGGATTVYARFAFDTEDHNLHTAGTYTLNVPAGMFKDAEGNLSEAFTATWTVKEQGEASTFAITGATNAGNEAGEVETLSYMFTINAANAITALHEGNITLTDSENQPVGGNAYVYGYEGEGGATTVYARFTFDTEDHNLHTAGTYTLNIPAGMFKDAEGNLSKAFTATWTVKGQETTTFAITSVTNGNNEGSDVEVLSYSFTITAANAITALHEGNITLTDAENNPVGGNAYVYGYEGEGGATTVYARFTFDTEDHNLHTAGVYTLNIPAGMFKDAEGNLSEAFAASWTVKEHPETSIFAITSVTNDGNEGSDVEALSSSFTIIAANAITALHEGHITLTNAENQPVGGNAYVTGYEIEGGSTTVYASFVFDTEDHNLHTAGTYTLNIPAGMFKDAEGNKNEAFTATWTVKGQDTAIEKLMQNVDARQGVYDLNGKRVNNIQKGKIYIVNGKRVMMK